MKLVHTNTGSQIKTGDIVRTQQGERVVVQGYSEPCKVNQAGRVYIRSIDGKGNSKEVYPSAISALFTSKTGA